MKTITEKLRTNHKRYPAMMRLRIWDRKFFQHQSWLNQGNGRGMNRKELQSPPPGASLPQGDPCPNPVCAPPGFSLSPRSAFSTAVIWACNSSALHGVMFTTEHDTHTRLFLYPWRGAIASQNTPTQFSVVRVCLQEYTAPQFRYRSALHSCSPGITAAKSVNKKF